MKKSALILRLLIICLCIIAGQASVSHGQSFEGVINYNVPNNTSGGTMDMQYMAKNGIVRWEFNQGGKGGGAMIFYPSQSKMVFIIDQMQGFMELDMDDMNADDSYDGKWKNSTMDKTGKTKTIAGYSCEIWKIQNDEGDALNLCMAKGLGSFMTPGNPLKKNSAPAWAKEIAGSDYMPLEVIEIADGNSETQMKATKIEKKSLAAALFQVPEGYKDMSAMLKQMQKMQGN